MESTAEVQKRRKDPVIGIPTEYPKVLYKTEKRYTDGAELTADIIARRIESKIVADFEQEDALVQKGFVRHVSELMKKQDTLHVKKA